MSHIALTSLQVHLVDLSASGQGKESPPSYVRISPVRYSELYIVLRFKRQRSASPGQQRLPLGNEPILSSIKVDCDNGRYWGLGADEGRYRTCGGNLYRLILGTIFRMRLSYVPYFLV
jgi:hypothetical protein